MTNYEIYLRSGKVVKFNGKKCPPDFLKLVSEAMRSESRATWDWNKGAININSIDMILEKDND